MFQAVEAEFVIPSMFNEVYSRIQVGEFVIPSMFNEVYSRIQVGEFVIPSMFNEVYSRIQVGEPHNALHRTYSKTIGQ